MPLPFEAELKSLLGSIAGETRGLPQADQGSSFYFLKDIGPAAPAGIGVPGATPQGTGRSVELPVGASAVRRQRHPPRFSDPVGDRERPAAGLVRQRGHDAKAESGHRSLDVLL